MTETTSHLRDHIATISKHEHEFLGRRTKSEKLGDLLGSFIGSLTFISIHILWFGAWMLVNLFHLGLRHFDPFPFALLDTLVALEAIFLASFIVMRQSRSSRRSDERDHLMLQILMLAEKEITAVLSIERKLAGRMGIREVAGDADIQQLSQQTSIDDLAHSVHQELFRGSTKEG